MKVQYERYEYHFDEKWHSPDGKEVTEVLNNFLCQKAIADGADPSLFNAVITDKSSEVKRKSIGPTLKKKSKKTKYTKIISVEDIIKGVKW